MTNTTTPSCSEAVCEGGDMLCCQEMQRLCKAENENTEKPTVGPDTSADTGEMFNLNEKKK